MAKILDANKITGNIQKIVETPHGYVVNGAYYDKNTMIVKPFKLFPGLGSPNDLAMNKRMALRTALPYPCLKTEDTIVVDRYDPTIFYVFTTALRDNVFSIMKFKETSSSIDLLNNVTVSGWPAANPYIRCVMGQDTNFLYFAMETQTTTQAYFCKIDKNTLVQSVVFTPSGYTSEITVFKETDTFIFYGAKRQFGVNQVWRFNKITQTNEVIPVTAKTGTNYFSASYTLPWVISDTEMWIYTVYQTATPNKMNIQRYKMDITKPALTDIIVESDATITWDGVATQIPACIATAYIKYECFYTVDSQNRRYLNIFIYENNGSSTAANLPYYGIYTFRIDDTTKDVTYKGYTSVSTSYPRGFLGIRNYTFLTAATDDATIFLAFDETTEKFVITDTLSNQPMHIGVDLDENIWVVNIMTEVDMYAPFVPTSVKLAYEKLAYKYEGADIDSFITIEAKNYSGANIAVNLELTITNGDAVFTSNSSKVIQETTGTTGPKSIPITIKGASNLTVTPKLIL